MALLQACVEAVREADIPNGALPQMHISGCPSSCGTHQTGEIGFRGAVKRVGDQPKMHLCCLQMVRSVRVKNVWDVRLELWKSQ